MSGEESGEPSCPNPARPAKAAPRKSSAQLIHGVRTTAEIVKVPKPIVNDSTDAQAEALVCDGGHPRATLP